MIRKRLKLPSSFLYLFGAPKYEAVVSLMFDLDLELVSARYMPLVFCSYNTTRGVVRTPYISCFDWHDPVVSDCQFEDPFIDVHKSDINFTQGCLFE